MYAWKKKKIKFFYIYFLTKHFYCIVFSARNTGGNKKSFPPFQVHGNKTIVTVKFPSLQKPILVVTTDQMPDHT